MPRVQVTVTSTTAGTSPAPGTPPVSATISIAVDQEPVDLKGLGNGVHIHWDIVTGGWRFPSNGIAIHNPGNKFRSISNNGLRHTWQRDYTDAGNYKYTITLTNGNIVVTWDPWIVNR
jgi:hypothetical protein